MADLSAYLDVHRDLWQQAWEAAHDWTAYLNRGDPKYSERWLAAYERTALTAQQTALLAGFTRRIHLLVLSGIWCGDCVRQGPIFRRLAEAAPTLRLRFAERDECGELADVLRVNGAKKVPVALFLSEDFFEVARFGDRTLSVYRAKAQREVGAACATGLVPADAEALAAEVGEWVDLVERVHLVLRTAPLLRERYRD
jgi:thiol-disulfide isomerase/thioredoxin